MSLSQPEVLLGPVTIKVPRCRISPAIQLLMSRSPTLPPVTILPETKASPEAVLREGESLAQLSENCICLKAEFRADQNAAVTRARTALSSADTGDGLMAADDFLARMQRRAEAAQQRICAAVAAQGKGSAK